MNMQYDTGATISGPI